MIDLIWVKCNHHNKDSSYCFNLSRSDKIWQWKSVHSVRASVMSFVSLAFVNNVLSFYFIYLYIYTHVYIYIFICMYTRKPQLECSSQMNAYL